MKSINAYHTLYNESIGRLHKLSAEKEAEQSAFVEVAHGKLPDLTYVSCFNSIAEKYQRHLDAEYDFQLLLRTHYMDGIEIGETPAPQPVGAVTFEKQQIQEGIYFYSCNATPYNVDASGAYYSAAQVQALLDALKSAPDAWRLCL